MLKHRLASFDIINPRFTLTPPCLITLKIEADAIEGNAGIFIDIRIMHIDMMEYLIQSKRIISVQQGFNHSRILVPHSTELREPFALNNIFPVDMRTGDGIQHVVKLIVCGTVQPELTHGPVDLPVVHHPVAHHGG